MFSGRITTASQNISRRRGGFFRYPFAALSALALSLFALSSPAGAKLNIIPVNQIKEGMKGTGRTVFHGLEISEFPIEVMGVLPGAGMSGDSLIMVKLTGPEKDDNGGISMGMSGSPIYINGKLAGALALTFPMTDHRLGGVTPIETMLKAGEFQTGALPGAPVKLAEAFVYGGKEYTSVRYDGEAGEGVLTAAPVAALVAVQGVGPRSYELMKSMFDNSGIQIAPQRTVGTALKTGADGVGPGSAIKPGSSVAVQLVRGDVDISAVGTVTAVDGDKVYMFGHPLFRKGDVKYLMADAHVVAIVQGDDMPFKMSSTGLLRGMVEQDRGSALVGKLNAFPDLIPIEVTVVNTDINRERVASVRVVPDEDIVANLIMMVALETLDNAIDKIGEGASKVSFSISAEGYDGVIARENMFYDKYDISSASLEELAQAIMMLSDNRFYDSPLLSVKVRVEISSRRSVAAIEKVKLVDWKSGSPDDKSDAAIALETVMDSTGATDALSEEVDDKPDLGGASETATGTVHVETAPPEQSAAVGLEAGASKIVAGLNEALEGGTEPILVGDDGDEGEEVVPVVYPGDKITLGVTLRPFREETVEETLFMRVPEDMEPGTANIRVSSANREIGGMGVQGFSIDIHVEGADKREQPEEDAPKEESPEESFDEVVKKFVEADKNNELIAAFEKFGFDAGQDSKDEEDETKEGSQDGKARKNTDWTLSGSATLKVKIGKPKDEGFKGRQVKKSKIGAFSK